MSYVRIPRDCDGLMQIGPFEIDQLGLFIISVGIGVVTKWIVTGIVVGLALSYFFGKFKQGKARGLLMHAAYWYGLFPFKSMWCDNGFMRDWTK